MSAERFGAELHVWELAVAQPIQRRRLGRRLLDTAQDVARKQALAALTLTTFLNVAWNAPFYARYGFKILDTDDLGERLKGVLHAESLRGLPDRCAMRMTLATQTG